MKMYCKSKIAMSALMTLVLVSACMDGEEELFLSVIATPSTVNVDDTVYFEIAGNAETFAIYTGDRGHNYDSSFLAVADGEELELSSLVLTADSLDSASVWLEGIVITYNNSVKNQNEVIRNDTTIEDSEKVYQDTIIFENLIADLNEFIVDKSFRNFDEAVYYVSKDAMSLLPITSRRELVEDYFEDRGTYLAPIRGYDTGVALDRYDLNYSYSYSRKGTYMVTVIATDVSWKKYSGSGYLNDRSASADEYNYNRLIKQIEIIVE